MAMRASIGRRAAVPFVHLALILIAAVAVVPLLWVVSTSFKLGPEVVTHPPTFFPHHPSLSAYVDLWTKEPYLLFTRNSFLVAIGSALLALAVSCLAAYGMARYRFKGVRVLLSIFLLSQMFPGASILIPVTQTVLRIGLYNTLPGLGLVYTAFFIPFASWMLYGYFRAIPRELDEAALIDGCPRMGILMRIIIPLTVPGLAATFVFSFLGAWNEYLFALVLTNNNSVRTLPVGVAALIGQYDTIWNMLCSSAIIFAVPPLVLFFLFEKALLKGLTAGAVKG
jgi:multiple sugar transport system permease protein